MVEISDIELFEKAAQGELSKGKNDVFVRRLAEDADFKANYENYKKIVTAIKQQQHYEELMVVLNESYKSKDWAAPAVEIESATSPIKYWLITAILLIVAVVVSFFIARAIYAGEERLADEESVSDQSEVVDSQPPEDQEVKVSDQTVEPTIDEPESTEPIPQKATPTAFMIAGSGYFITQYSAVNDARSLRLRQNDTTEYKVDMVVHDTDLNIAVLRLEQGQVNSLSSLPFRLATTQAFANTEVMVVGRNGQLVNREGVISALESNGSFNHYELEIDDAPEFSGAAVISKNGNIVAIGISQSDGAMQYLKSTHVVGMLARSTGEPGMDDYIPAANNRLAGLEREDQLERIAPFVLEVIKFY